MKYRSKPVEVEAVQISLLGESDDTLRRWAKTHANVAQFGDMIYRTPNLHWIIKDGDTFSVCSDDEFKRKYEPLVMSYESALFPMRAPDFKQGDV